MAFHNFLGLGLGFFLNFNLVVDKESFFISMLQSVTKMYKHFLSVIKTVTSSWWSFHYLLTIYQSNPTSWVSQVRANRRNKNSSSQTFCLSLQSHYLSHDKVNAAESVVLCILDFHCPRPARGFPSKNYGCPPIRLCLTVSLSKRCLQFVICSSLNCTSAMVLACLWYWLVTDDIAKVIAKATGRILRVMAKRLWF